MTFDPVLGIFILISTIIVVCWLAIDKEDFQERFDKARHAKSEDSQ